MVKGFEISLTERQGKLLEDALRKYLTLLNDSDTVEGMSSANVVRNTLAQVKDGLYTITMENAQ
jgi:hypothetical protein